MEGSFPKVLVVVVGLVAVMLLTLAGGVWADKDKGTTQVPAAGDGGQGGY